MYKNILKEEKRQFHPTGYNPECKQQKTSRPRDSSPKSFSNRLL